jgi:hypothetical protein
MAKQILASSFFSCKEMDKSQQFYFKVDKQHVNKLRHA